MAKAKNPSLYRALRHLRSGGLHRALHVAPDEKIPESKISAGLHSDNEHIRKMSQFAKTMSGFKH
jgi:hypothetical protein